MSSETLPVIIAQWPRNASDTVIIKIDQFKGTAVIDIRDWSTLPTGELRPRQRGITMSVRHLPSLAHALTKAETTARELGLLAGPDEA
jgi:Transcriptional Coactivator p15 (PC4)